MSISTKNFKEKENELHEALFNNILVLSMKYDTTKEFDAHFRRDMFTKNNKAAFQHITHFLLNVLDSEVFKQKICWPILDNKMEIQFRNEVIKYINEFPNLYEDCNVPLLMTSHLISPGGYRFTEFMHKLSQFVLLEDLKRTEMQTGPVLLPPKVSTDNLIALRQRDNLTALTDDNHIELLVKQADFIKNYNNIQATATEITNKKCVIDQMLLDTKHQFRQHQELMKKELADVDFMEKSDLLTEISKNLERIRIKESELKNCAELVDILCTNKNVLRYERNIKIDDDVSLVEYLERFLDILKRKRYLTECANTNFFTMNLPTLNELIVDLNESCEKYEKLNAELLCFVSHLEEFIANYKYDDNFIVSPLLCKVRKVYEKIPNVNIRLSNLR